MPSPEEEKEIKLSSSDKELKEILPSTEQEKDSEMKLLSPKKNRNMDRNCLHQKIQNKVK